MMLNTQTTPRFKNECQNQSREIDWRSWCPKRGEIYLIKFEGIDSEQQGLRPALIVSNNIGNKHSSIVSICPITSKNRPLAKIHVKVDRHEGLKFSSYILCEHLQSVSKRRFFNAVNNNSLPIKVGKLSDRKLQEVEAAIIFELGFGENNKLRI